MMWGFGGGGLKRKVERYFELIHAMRGLARKDPEKRVRLAIEATELLPALVESEMKEWGKFDIPCLPSVDVVLRELPNRLDRSRLHNAIATINSVPVLRKRFADDIQSSLEWLGSLEETARLVVMHHDRKASEFPAAEVRTLIKYGFLAKVKEGRTVFLRSTGKIHPQ